MATDKAKLDWAIGKWKEAAADPSNTPALKKACENTVKALEIERDTGVVTCSCCLLPVDKCLKKKRT